MFGFEENTLECPFCQKGMIDYAIRAGVKSAKRTACRAGKSTAMVKCADVLIIRTEKCPVCGKSSEEIERKWKKDNVF
jgi:hypothetical protein